ncbi:uncharacterized protein ACB058_017724 isoform 1-T1 [Synchiropus picturatus]
MAQSVRRTESVGAMDHERLQRNTNRTSYFGNVKSRLGSKLPTSVSQPAQFAKGPWETQPLTRLIQDPVMGKQHQPITCRPLNHIPHIRNPKLRQYYLQGTSWDLNPAVKQDLSDDGSQVQGSHGDTVFSVSAKFTSGDSSDRLSSQLLSLSAPFGAPEQLKEKTGSTSRGLPQPEPAKLKAEADPVSPAPTQSPSPEAEYDKLLDVEAVPLPDGQLCLLALPPECCEGEGPEATSYLKLFCRYVTDCKGVVSGILLVTSNKIFFDPSKNNPLVKEHGCEEYLLSCSVDSLVSVSFCADISHVHFSNSQHKKKGKKAFLKRTAQDGDDHKREPIPTIVPPSAVTSSVAEEEESESESAASDVLGVAAASFCCGGREEPGKESRLPANEPSGRCRSAHPGSVMFVRLRVQPTSGKSGGSRGQQLGVNKTRRDAWFVLSQESSDELYSYLTRCRPDLCVTEGGEEEEGEGEEEDFVLIEDQDEAEGHAEETLQKRCSSGDDWEMVLMEESGEKPPLITDRDPDGASSIAESSQILEASHVRDLLKELPPRTVGHTWQLSYSTSRHGASLKTLYRKLSAIDSPALVVIKDALDEVFGAFLSHPLKPSEKFYGTGETFLFMLHPRFKCFRWTGENSFFIKGDLDSFSVGGGSGHFGLWVDENLYLGRSSPCYTFNNCCLSETDDFRVMELEVWTFS